MKLKILTSVGFIIAFSTSVLLNVGCGGNHEDNQSSFADSTSNTILKVNNKIFSIPSPLQTAILIKRCGVKYKRDLLNDPNKSEHYVSNFSKAINLGIYGTDLGYVAIYDQKQDALGFMKSAKSLTEGLGISDVFSGSMMDRLNKNFNDKDSLLALISDAYGSTNAYLNHNEQNDISGLVLTGGWIESLYLTTEIYNVGLDDEIKRRIAEQKTSLERVISILKPFGEKPEYADLITNMKKLSTIYQNVNFNNTFVQASTDSKKRLTVVNSKTEINITDEQMKEISTTIKEIRKKIIE